MRKSIVLRGRRVAYELERKRVRRISLRIRPDGTPAVSAPPLTPALLIEKLLLSRGDWILAQIERREAETAQRENAVYLLRYAYLHFSLETVHYLFEQHKILYLHK